MTEFAIDKQVSPEERLWCLIMALVSSGRGLSKNEIFKDVRGYREDFRTTGPSQALDKMFEYDKKHIKTLGIPLTTSVTENPADAVYSISESDYEALQFSDFDVTLLTAAGAMWRDSALANDAREARMKLLAADVDGDSQFDSLVPHIHTAEDSYAVLSEAILDGKSISFPYLKPGQFKPEMRYVSPLSIVNFDGRWHLLAFDDDRGAERTFLLRRIVGKVVTGKPAEVRPDSTTTSRFSAHLTDLWNSLTATIRVAPQTKAAVALKNRSGTDIDGDLYTVHYIDEAVFADELCEYGAEAIVLEPQSLRDAVITRLETLVADHG